VFKALGAMESGHKQHRRGGCNTQKMKKSFTCAWSFKHYGLYTHKKQRAMGGRGGGVQHIRDNKKNTTCVWSSRSYRLWTQETQRRGGATHNRRKKIVLCTWSSKSSRSSRFFYTRNIEEGGAGATPAQARNIQDWMFFKKFKNLNLEPTYTSRGFYILYIRSLTAITLREVECKATKTQM
jgi:hypothetical protein